MNKWTSPPNCLGHRKNRVTREWKGKRMGGGGRGADKSNQRAKERKTEGEKRALLPNMSQFPTTVPFPHSSAAAALDVTRLFGLNEARSFPNHNKHIQRLGPAQLSQSRSQRPSNKVEVERWSCAHTIKQVYPSRCYGFCRLFLDFCRH